MSRAGTALVARATGRPSGVLGPSGIARVRCARPPTCLLGRRLLTAKLLSSGRTRCLKLVDTRQGIPSMPLSRQPGIQVTNRI